MPYPSQNIDFQRHIYRGHFRVQLFEVRCGCTFFFGGVGGIVELWCLTPLSTILQLYCGGRLYWCKTPEYMEKAIEYTFAADIPSEINSQPAEVSTQ